MFATRIRSFAALALAAGTLAGCGGDGGGSSSKNRLEGVWQRVDGTLFAIDGLDELRFLDFRDEGRGELYGVQPSTNVRECANFLYSPSGEGTLSIDVPDFNDGTGNARLLLWDRDGSTLTLSDHTGNETTFERVDEVPATELCVVADTEILALPFSFQGYSGNLTSDGTNLWYQGDQDLLIALDPATATTAMTYANSPGFPVAAEPNGDLWTICHCGGGESLSRWTLPSTLVDTVDMDDVSGHNFSVESAGYRGGALWVSGYQYDTETSVFYQVDSVSEPDVPVLFTEGPLDGLPFAFVGDERWVLVYGLTPKLARVGIDGLAAESVGLPPSISYFYSIASHDGAVYLTSFDDSNQPILMRVTLP